MTDTNKLTDKQKSFLKKCKDLIDEKKEEETFESYINSYIEVYKNVLKSKNKLLMDEKEELERLEYIKQLHDNEVNGLKRKFGTRISEYECLLNNLPIERRRELPLRLNNVKLGKQIKELQAEVERLSRSNIVNMMKTKDKLIGELHKEIKRLKLDK